MTPYIRQHILLLFKFFFGPYFQLFNSIRKMENNVCKIGAILLSMFIICNSV